MIEQREDLRFALEAGEAFGVEHKGLWQNLQRDVAIQLRVARPIHLSHPAGADGVLNLVIAEAGASRQGQSARQTWPILADAAGPLGAATIFICIGRGRSTPAISPRIYIAGCNDICNSRALEARMLLRTLTVAALLVTLLSTGTATQNASSVVAAASKAMGVDTLNSITYSGTARNGAFGQSKSIGEPMGPVNVTRITEYTRTINFGQASDPMALVSRATGPTQPPTVPGVPAPMPGVFNQNITGTQASSNWNQALNIWTTPWGFLKGAAANNATVRQEGGQQLVSFSPPNLKSPSGQTYSVTGHINNQNLVTKVETRVDNAVVGDLLVEFEYSNYQNMNGVQVPTRIVQKQAGMQTFDAEIKSATPESLEPDGPPHAATSSGRRWPWWRSGWSSAGTGSCAGRETWRRGLQDRW